VTGSVGSEEHEIDAGGFRTHFIEAGVGSTVVLIHGSGPGVSAYANWRFLIPVLAERFHILAPDVLGFGKSARPDGMTYSKKLWVEHLIAFLGAKGVERCSIVGNSMGGALALAIAIERPDLVERLVLMGAAGLSFPLTEGLDAVWGYEPSMTAMHDLIARHFAFDAKIASDELVRMRYEASCLPGYHESYRTMFPAPRQAGIELLSSDQAAIATIKNPTLLVHGREDRVIPLSVSERLLQLIPDAELHVFGQCGHWTQIERKDAFNELTLHFLMRG
jgi:pimeloyl-ACP methyl ester carboxylesterase